MSKGNTRVILVAMFATLVAAPAGATEPCVFPAANVFAFVCANTSNNSDGSVLSVDGAGNLSSQIGSNLFGVTTTNLGTVKPGTAIIASNYGLGGSKNGVGASANESPHFPGTGAEDATAQLGTSVNGTWTAIPFANGNIPATTVKFSGNTLVPDLHATAAANVTQSDVPGYGGQSFGSGGLVIFSDIVTVSQSQVDAVNAMSGVNLAQIWVRLDYVVSGSAVTSPTMNDGSFGEATGSFNVSATLGGTGTTESDGGNFDIGPLSNQDNLLGQEFQIYFQVIPGYQTFISATLGASGQGTSAPGDLAGYNANLGDTAKFMGADFFADGEGTIPLPTLELDSAFGFNYAPVTILDSVGGVPEPSTWAILLLGFCGVGFATRLLKLNKAVISDV